ncbi:MAG: hypothetical protein AAFW69_04615, partial [Pseudomonadota bacterium]
VKNWEAWARHSSHYDEGEWANACKSFEEIAGDVAPDGTLIANKNLNPDAIAKEVLKRAEALRPQTYGARQPGAEKARTFLQDLTSAAYAHLLQRPDFIAQQQPAIWREALERLDRIEAMVAQILERAATKEDIDRATLSGVERREVIRLAQRISLATTAEAIAADRAAGAPAPDRPEIPDLDTAYSVQDAAWAGLGALAGWKIAWNTEAARAKAGVTTSAVGRVLASDRRESGVAIAATDFSDLLIEPEIIAVLGRDLPARTGGYSAAEAGAAVAHWVPGFELIDRRANALTHAPTAVANSIFNAGFVMGGPGAAAPEGRVRVLRDAEVLLEGDATAPEPPAAAVAFVASTLSARGIGMDAGQIVLCGAHLPPAPIPGPCEMVMEVAGLGEARFTYG